MTLSGNRSSVHAVLDRAVALADAGGLRAVTVRRLTQELGVTPMALYWHFRNKEHLLDGLTERVIARIDLDVDRAANWLALITDEPGSADEQAQRQERAFLESLPPDRYPRVIEAAIPLATCDDPDAYYAFGLRLLLAGIAIMPGRAP